MLPSDASLPDKPNAIYARFEASNTEPRMSAPAVPEGCVISLSVADVIKTFKQVNIHKAVGSDGLPGCELRACTDQLTGIFTDIFNLSLTDSVIPICIKQTTIVPVPKKAKISCLNYYRPIALMSVAMKCFERLVMAHIKTIIPQTLDPSNSHTAPTDAQMTQSHSHSTLPFPTQTKGTPMLECCSFNTAQCSTR